MYNFHLFKDIIFRCLYRLRRADMDLRPKFGFSCLKKTKIGQLDQKPPKHVFWSIYYHGTTSGAKIRSLIPLCWNIDQIWKTCPANPKSVQILVCFKLIVLRAQEELNAHIWSDWQSIDEFDGSDKKSSKKICQSRKNDQFEVKLLFEWLADLKNFHVSRTPPNFQNWVSGQKIKTMHGTLA